MSREVEDKRSFGQGKSDGSVFSFIESNALAKRTRNTCVYLLLNQAPLFWKGIMICLL